MKRIIFLIVITIFAVGMLAISGCGKEKVYTVTFNANGGTGEMKEQIFVKDVSQTLVSNAFVRVYYSFAGWNTISDGSGVAYFDAQEITINSDITLYAQWEQSTFKITFDANGGTGSMDPMAIDRGEVKNLPENTFARSGYIFYGWATSEKGEFAYPDKGKIMNVTEDLTLYAQWAKPEGGKQAVDLGLPSGLKWASCNVGAENPEENGDYYAWGETTTKETYYWSTYKYCNGSYGRTLTKYCNNAEYGYEGFTDNLTTLEASDDVATANWGNGWRMPTKEDLEELMNNCSIGWTTYNGVNGCVFVGQNGKSIFLPAVGQNFGDYIGATTSGYYLTSSLNMDDPTKAWLLGFSSSSSGIGNYCERYRGLSVRAVCQ